jgi:hypothetical protein
MKWLAILTAAILFLLAAARCSRDVDLGVAPNAGIDGGSGDAGMDGVSAD